MSKGNTFENDFLKLIFNATTITNLADNTITSPATSLYVSLHTADPGEAGSQTTSEAAYTSYARAAVVRTSSGWTVTNNSVSPAATVSFPTATGGSETETFFGVGTDSTGAGKLLYSGPLASKQGAFIGVASDDTIRAPGSSFSVNDQVVFEPVDGFSLPTGITAGTAYFILTVSGTTYTISTTQGGSTLNITADGCGYLFKLSSIAVSSGITPQLTTSTTITED